MLVGLKEVLEEGKRRNIAIANFNTPNLETLIAVIEAAEELDVPVIIAHAQLHERIAPLHMVGPMMVELAKRSKAKICVHLDHGTDLDYVKRGLDLGFTSVMYDGSAYDEELNYANTCIARELSLAYGASLEAEIGSMGAREGSATGDTDESIYTDPAEAKKFVDETGVDALACAFGTAHGVYLKAPKLDFPRLEKIKSLVDVPLVMHGGSGVSVEDYKKVIDLGIRKINYYTYMAKAGAAAVAALADKTFYHDIEVAAINGMKADVMSAMKVFANK